MPAQRYKSSKFITSPKLQSSYKSRPMYTRRKATKKSSCRHSRECLTEPAEVVEPCKLSFEEVVHLSSKNTSVAPERRRNSGHHRLRTCRLAPLIRPGRHSQLPARKAPATSSCNESPSFQSLKYLRALHLLQRKRCKPTKHGNHDWYTCINQPLYTV